MARPRGVYFVIKCSIHTWLKVIYFIQGPMIFIFVNTYLCASSCKMELNTIFLKNLPTPLQTPLPPPLHRVFKTMQHAHFVSGITSIRIDAEKSLFTFGLPLLQLAIENIFWSPILRQPKNFNHHRL